MITFEQTCQRNLLKAFQIKYFACFLPLHADLIMIILNFGDHRQLNTMWKILSCDNSETAYVPQSKNQKWIYIHNIPNWWKFDVNTKINLLEKNCNLQAFLRKEKIVDVNKRIIVELSVVVIFLTMNTICSWFVSKIVMLFFSPVNKGEL